jgi:hypothetical protein
MSEYPKIESLWRRESEKPHRLLIGQYASRAARPARRQRRTQARAADPSQRRLLMRLKECHVCHRVGSRAFVSYGDWAWSCARGDLCLARVRRDIRRWLRPLSTQQLMDIVWAHQTDPRAHPLTCGNDSSHVLHPRRDGSAIVLICPRCTYDQNWIPWASLRAYATRRHLIKEEN